MKKYLLLTLCLPLSVSAITFGKHKSDRDGSTAQVYHIEGTEASYDKNSNIFDVSSSDYRIGHMTTKSEKLKIIYEDLKEFEKKLDIVNTALKKKKTSFNEVAGQPGHRAMIVVGNYRIMPESQYYAELNAKFNELQSYDWTLDKGYRISSDLKLVYLYRNGKIEKTENYQVGAYCKESRKECTYSDGGRIFISQPVNQ